MKDIGPQLAISTVRQRKSHLNAHLLPRFGSMSLMSIDVQTLQRFVTELSTGGSRKSTLNLLGTMNAILSYAKKRGMRTLEIPEGSLTIAGDRDGAEAVYFKRADVQRIIAAAREPYRTMSLLASVTGLRVGELLGLTAAGIDFDRLMVGPRKQADDRTRVLRELKTKRSRTPVPITQETARILRDYLEHRWSPNPQGLLLTNRRGRPCKRANAVKFGLHPVLKKLGLPTHHAGLHAFRHGLGTALATQVFLLPLSNAPCVIPIFKRRCGSTFTQTLMHSVAPCNHYKCSDYYKLFALTCWFGGGSGRGGGDRKQYWLEFQGLTRNAGER
jgi:integrase